MSATASVHMELDDALGNETMDAEHSEPKGSASGSELSDRESEHDTGRIGGAESFESEDNEHSDGEVGGSVPKRQRRASSGITMQSVSSEWKRKEPTSLLWTNSDITPGPTFSMYPCVCTAASYFSLIFTQTVWHLLVVETNRYADQVQLTEGARVWYPVTIEEMKAYMGIIVLMGVLCLPCIELYWQTSHELLRQPLASVMSLTRFQQIWRFLHLSDATQQKPAGHPEHDKLFKVRPLIRLLQDSFENLYNLHRQVTIDEAMIPLKGRLSIVQYMKAKPTKWGIKVFVLSDAISAYIYRFHIYTGRGLDSDTASIGLCNRSVLDLLNGLNYLELYTDNYYTSPELYLHLYNEYGINACGTIRTNRRGYPKALVLPQRVANRNLEASWTTEVMGLYLHMPGRTGEWYIFFLLHMLLRLLKMLQ